MGRPSLQRPLDGCGTQANVHGKRGPAGPRHEAAVAAQSTETVPTPAACSLRATERAVSS